MPYNNTNMGQTDEKTLKDYLDLFNEKLNSDDKQAIADDIEMSISTVNNYLAGAIRNKVVGEAILKKGLQIIHSRNI